MELSLNRKTQSTPGKEWVLVPVLVQAELDLMLEVEEALAPGLEE